MMHTAPEANTSLFFGGSWHGAATNMAVENPFDGKTLGHVACATLDDVERAIVCAVRGQVELRRLSCAERAGILHRTAAALEKKAMQFAEMITAETGKPVRAATKEVARAVNTLRLSAEEAGRITGETIAFDGFPGGEGRSGYYIYEPVGVVVAITPFNDPLNLVCHKLGPAFAAGNSIVLKPAEQAPLIAVMLVKLFLSAGLPREAINLLTGYGRDFGAALVAHDDVAMVSFTGGARVGAEIINSSGVKRIGMELGANSPVIVTHDADIEKAAGACVSGSFWAAGQNCIGVQRIFVHESIYDAFRDLMVDKTKALNVGDPMLALTDVGPMISKRESRRLAEWTEEAIAGGAKVLTGGKLEGNIFLPTILEDVPRKARIACQEVFGPVVSLFSYTDLDDAIAEANAVDYSIHAAIFTQSIRVAHHASRHLQAAGVMINDSTDYRLDAMPFGGAKRGNMGREGVRFAIREMSQTKVVCFNEG